MPRVVTGQPLGRPDVPDVKRIECVREGSSFLAPLSRSSPLIGDGLRALISDSRDIHESDGVSAIEIRRAGLVDKSLSAIRSSISAPSESGTTTIEGLIELSMYSNSDDRVLSR